MTPAATDDPQSPADITRGQIHDESHLAGYRRWHAQHGRTFADHRQMHRWSVENLGAFWESIRDHFGVRGCSGPALTTSGMPGATWFPEARLNYAEHALAPGDGNRPAIVARSQTRGPIELTAAELADQVARCAAGLRRLGVGPGDRVVGYLPNIPEAVVAFLACAGLGAVWAACPPEFGARSVVDRFRQLDPVVLLAVGGYDHGDKHISRQDDLALIRDGLPSLRHVVGVAYGRYRVTDALAWADLLAGGAGLPTFERVGFSHPLVVLFSSGTTGPPKAIVHGHGGLLLEHLKALALHLDVRADDRALWITTTAWTMWNIVVSALLLRAAVILVDGDVADPLVQWRIAEETGATLLGTSPGYLMAGRDAGVRPAESCDLSALRTVGVTGAPLPSHGHRWLRGALGSSVMVNVLSGGTDVCTAFLGGTPGVVERPGLMSGAWLGVDATTVDEHGRERLGELGELVIRRPMPSMPVGFWNDTDGIRYREAYFATFPGVWRHGDWAVVDDAGRFAVTGRSDATLNRGGVRLGTAEFYAVVEDLPEIADSLVIHLESDDGGAGRLLLFVVTAADALDDALRDRIRRALRSQLSPRHLPDQIHAIDAVPRTLTGKKLETPVKRILQGRPPAQVVDPEAITDFEALLAFVPTDPTPTPEANHAHS